MQPRRSHRFAPRFVSGVRARGLAASVAALSLCLSLALSACGGPKPSPSGTTCPPHMALIGGKFCIDRYEAALAELDSAKAWSHAQPIGNGRVRAVVGPGLRSQVNITEIEAEIACENSGKHLCSLKEWTEACRGNPPRTYPYGATYSPGTCNDARDRPSGAGADLTEPRLAEQPGTSAPGGAFPRCKTPEGVFDMHGNVHEWVRDNSHGDDPRYGMFLGGYFADAKLNGPGCSYKTTAHFKAYRDYSIGFRCCAEPSKTVR